MEEIINKVAQSSLVNFDLEDFYTEGKRLALDIAQFYNDEEILREKEFRETLKSYDWSLYQDALVYVYDSNDAILPAWTMLLVTSHLSQVAKYISFGNKENLETELFINQLTTHNFLNYENQKVIVKGCSKKYVPTSAYVFVIQKLQPIVSSLMYGEACSSVPLYKAKK